MEAATPRSIKPVKIALTKAANADSDLIRPRVSPADHRWRLIPASNVAAVRISGLVLAMALIYGTATFLQTAAYLFKAPNSPRLALTLFPNTIIALLIVAILQTPLRSERIGGLPSASWLRILRLPIWLLALAIIASAASGYLYLSRFITQQLIVTGAILTIVYLMLLWADGIAQAMGSEKSGIGRWLSATGHLDHSGRQRLSVPVSLLLKFGVMLCAIPLILNQWQFSWPDIFEWYRQLFFGFRIGNTQVSLAALFASVVVFALGYFAAKFFQQWLDTQILKPAGLSGGLRDSIRTGVGYVGIAAAALFALSYAGLQPVEPRYRRGRLLGRHRLRLAERRQQLRVGPDPAWPSVRSRSAIWSWPAARKAMSARSASARPRSRPSTGRMC